MQALVLRQLTKVYKNGIKALKGIDLEVAEGDFFALLGPNGAGKTTAIGIITSLVNKTGGTVEVFGYDLDLKLELAKSCIGIVPQEVNFNVFESVFTIVVNQAGFYGIPRRLAKQRAEKEQKCKRWRKTSDEVTERVPKNGNHQRGLSTHPVGHPTGGRRAHQAHPQRDGEHDSDCG